MRESFNSEVLYGQWQAMLERLTEATAPTSGLAGPLAAYVVDCAGAIHLEDVRALRDQYGIAEDPSAEELWPLLALDD